MLYIHLVIHIIIQLVNYHFAGNKKKDIYGNENLFKYKNIDVYFITFKYLFVKFN